VVFFVSIGRCAVDSCEKVYPFLIVRSSCSCLAGDLSGMYEKVPPSHSTVTERTIQIQSSSNMPRNEVHVQIGNFDMQSYVCSLAMEECHLEV